MADEINGVPCEKMFGAIARFRDDVSWKLVTDTGPSTLDVPVSTLAARVVSSLVVTASSASA